METLPFIQWCLAHLNYFSVTVLMAIESTLLPMPSELVVPPAAYMAAADGRMNIVLVILFATLGANIGSIINYFLGVWVGRPVLLKFASSKLGRLCMLNEEKILKVEKFYRDKGAWSVFVGRLLPGVRHLISIPAGIAGMKFSTFLLYNTLGAALWNIVLAACGYALESVMPMSELFGAIVKYSHFFYLAVVIGLCVTLGIFFVRSRILKARA